MSMPEPPRQPADPPADPAGRHPGPPPGWTTFTWILPGFAAGSLLGSLLLALLLVFDVGQLRTLLRSDTPPHWSIFLAVPLLSGFLGAMITSPAGKGARR